jgi:hypothetical protein
LRAVVAARAGMAHLRSQAMAKPMRSALRFVLS